MKIIPLLMPVSENLITAETPVEDRGKRAELSTNAMKMADDLLEKHPEVKIVMACLYTPPEVRGAKGTYDWNHTMLASQDGATVDDVKSFLDVAIPALLKLRISVEEDPSIIGAMRAKQ